MTTETLMVYCSCPDERAGADMASALVEQGLAACINVLPGVTSIYKWHGEMKSGTEVLLLIKTASDRCDALTAELVNIHPYELPEIIAVPVTAGHQPYLDWIKDCTR